MINYLIIPFILYIGILTSFSDVKGGKVLNKHIILGFKLGAIWHVFYVAFTFFSSKEGALYLRLSESAFYLEKIIVNVVIATVLGFCMWWFNLWAAGDAKLFAVFSLLLPFDFYSGFFVKYFPSFLLLLNIFICSITIVFFDFFYKLFNYIAGVLKKRRLKTLLRIDIKDKLFNKLTVNLLIKLGKLFLSFLFTFITTSKLSNYLLFLFKIVFNLKVSINLEAVIIDETFIFFLLFLLFKPISRLYENLIVYYSVILSLAGLIIFQFLNFPAPELILKLLKLALLSGALISFHKLYEFYITKLNVFNVPLKEVKKGMVLSPNFINKIKEDAEFFEENFKTLFPDGLTQNQVESIFKWNEKNNLRLMFVEVSATMSFAICIFAGVVVTIVLKGIFLVNFLL